MMHISTPLLKPLKLLGLLCLLLAFASGSAYAQCSAETPVYQVDLTGKPNGVWSKSSVSRAGLCCNASPDQNKSCVSFEVTLDKLSGGLKFDISQPAPSGSMFYQIGCGAMIPVGQPVCVMGAGPHIITVCMPGGATNTYTVTSIAAYEPVADAAVTVGCSQQLLAPIAFDPATVTWKDITYGGTYNKYLSCTSGCGTTTVTPDASPPAFVDYEVCGNSTTAVCTSIPYCDVVRVFFYPPILVDITPDPAIICPGSNGVQLSSTVSGGSGTYQYIWTNSAGTQLASTQTYFATTVGTYTLEVRNENYPNCSTKYTDQITVTNELAVNAGPDQQVCSQSAVQLTGTVTGAGGGIWSGGSGTYNPSSTDLNALYTPTAEEIAAGSVTLTLSTTDNGSCTSISDQVKITLYSFTATIDASKTVCKGSTATLTANVSGGISPFTYKWSSDEFTQSISSKAAGTYSVTVTDAKGCTSKASATVTEVVGPTDLTASAKSSTCGSANGEITVSAVTGGTSPYTYSKDGTTFQTSNIFTGLISGTYTITAKDANGCVVSKSVAVSNIAGPTAVSATTRPASCKNNDGSIEVGTVTGGTSAYTYSIDGATFQTSKTFTGLAAGTYTITAKDANGCLITTTASVGTNVPTDLTATTKSSTCGSANGELIVTAVSAGTSPYSYSIDGTTFQTSATFSGLLAKAYTVTVKDANGCTYSESVTVTNIPGPSDLTSSTKPTTCGRANGSITVSAVTGGTSPYSYSNGGSVYQTSNTFDKLPAGEYTLWVKDANGCTYSEKVTLTDIPGPSDFTATTKPTSCGRSNGEISVSAVTGGTSPYTYSKDGASFQTSATFGSLLAGTYTITVKDANGCLFAKDVELKDIPGPSDMNIASIPSTCGSANGELKVVSVTSGTSPYSYSLNGGAYQTSAIFGGMLAGEHQITVKDANGCTFSRKAVVENIPGPSDATVSTKPSTCSTNNGEITVNAVTGGTSPYSYSINGTIFQTGTTFSKLLAGTYTLTVKDANGCSYTEAVILNDLAGPTAITASTTPSSCTVNDGSLTVTAVSGGSSPYTYSIDGTSYQSEALFSALAPDTYTVWVKDNNGCSTSAEVTVGTNGPTAAETTVVAASCGLSDGSINVGTITAGTSPFSYSLDGATFQETTTFSGLAAGTYTLTIKDSKGCTLEFNESISNTGGAESFTVTPIHESCDSNNGSIQVSEVVGGTSPYTYSINGTTFQSEALFTSLSEGTYQVRVKDARGCLTIREQVLTNSPAPTAFRYSTQQETCGEANGSVTVSVVTGGTAPYSYSADGQTFQEASTIEGLAAGNYQLTVRDANGCTYAETIVIEGITGPSDVSFTSKDASCFFNDGEISIAEVVGGTSPYSYSLDGTSFQTFATFTGLDAGAYTLYVRDANGCAISREAFVNRPGAVLNPLQPVSCFGGNDGSISFTVVGGTDFTEFSIDGGLTFQKEPLFSNLVAGTYGVIAKISAECTLTFDNLIIEEPAQITALVTQTSKAMGGQANGTAEISDVQGGTGPYFFTVDGVAYGATTSLIALAEGEHTLIITDSNACEETILFMIEGFSDLEIPNGFTPNGDGINDHWALKNISSLFPNCKVSVYNRWGSPIFQSSGYKTEWNGTHNGKQLPDGTYYYIIQLNDQEKPMKGTVTIMR